MFLVAVEADRPAGVIEYWRRGDQVKARRVEHQPWMLVPQPVKGSFLSDLRGEKLMGEEGFNRLLTFDTWHGFYDTRRLIHGRDEAIAHASPAKNYLMQQSYRLFEGAKFEETVRLVIDIEATGLDPCQSEVILLAYQSNRGHRGVFTGSEQDILRGLVQTVEIVDPDVIEGHNIFGYDFPFLLTRANLLGVRLPMGRDGSQVRQGRERRVMVGPNERYYSPTYIHGRHILDTFLAVQRYDVAAQRLNSYGLKECARTFGIAAEGRVELDRERMEELFESDPALVEMYALQDVEESLKLGNIILPVEFYQTQIIPDSYQGIATTGNGEKVNSLLVAEYLKRGHAIPFRQEARDYIGGYVEVRETGVLRRVVKADVESLYPSLMLTRNIRPSADTENVMLPMLASFKDQRIEAKYKAKAATDPQEAQFYDGLQDSFKRLINSFYGYLGGPFNFNDFSAAMAVTMGGRELVGKVADTITEMGGKVIEIDTDGVMFVPPAEVSGEGEERTFVDKVGAMALPAGIKLAHDGRYQAMLSLKMKNYVLQDYDGKLTIKGASLKARSSEAFGKRFLKDAIMALFEERKEDVIGLYHQLLHRIVGGMLPISDLGRRERVTEATKSSPMKARLREITGGLKIGDYLYVYEKADGTLNPVEDYNGDENTLYYCDKLYKYAYRLMELFGGDEQFKRLFPKPGKRWLAQYRKVLEEVAA